jgi:ATP-dependent DNA helicase RecQ
MLRTQSVPPSHPSDLLAPLRELIAQHWGFRELRPLQEQAMRAVLEQHDSLVVMPTGGGKSLCFQAPALSRADEITVVVSPLIALMKDQVDSLRAVGVPAVHIDSSLSDDQRRDAAGQLRARKSPLLFVSPERLMMSGFQGFLQELGVKTFAIDEAHCISHWGHDFRPEYRQLARLRELFPHASFHAYTATATEQVRRDIVEQLGLREPEILVGDFDRPNLTYRVLPRQRLVEQVQEVLKRHLGEAGIIYCIRKKDVDQLAATLREYGHNALPYHADLPAEVRKRTHEDFRAERCNLVVATVAFGMGIDRPDIRFVLHTGMTPSVEHYQQETGRAGRDGLEAECVLFYSGADVVTRRNMTLRDRDEGKLDPELVPGILTRLEKMAVYARGSSCRHKMLVEHFGQTYQAAGCKACDVCLAELDFEPESRVIAQKILSCVARVGQRFGVGHVVAVLRGQDTERIRQWRHDQLSTYGLLKECAEKQVRDWTYQLVEQGALTQTDDEYPVLKLNDTSWEVLRNQRDVRLLKVVKKAARRAREEIDSMEGVDEELMEVIRSWRRSRAEARGMPPFTIFHDSTLRELCRVRPSSLEALRLITGIGDTKLRDFGAELVALLRSHCGAKGLSMDVPVKNVSPRIAEPAKLSATAEASFPLFRRGASIDQVKQKLERAASTVMEYLCAFIRDERPKSIEPWVSPEVQARVLSAARQVGALRLKPIFVALGEQVSYDTIRIVLAHAQVMGELEESGG